MNNIICKITNCGITKEVTMEDKHLDIFIKNINDCLSGEKKIMGFINQNKSVIYFPAELVKNSFIEFEYINSSRAGILHDFK